MSTNKIAPNSVKKIEQEGKRYYDLLQFINQTKDLWFEEEAKQLQEKVLAIPQIREFVQATILELIRTYEEEILFAKGKEGLEDLTKAVSEMKGAEYIEIIRMGLKEPVANLPQETKPELDLKKKNKALATKAKEVLKSLGHEIPQTHAYELISRLAGYRSWNAAKGTQADICEKLSVEASPSNWHVVSPTIRMDLFEKHKKHFDLFLKLQLHETATMGAEEKGGDAVMKAKEALRHHTQEYLSLTGLTKDEYCDMYDTFWNSPKFKSDREYVLKHS